jgi:hypothetical protein
VQQIAQWPLARYNNPGVKPALLYPSRMKCSKMRHVEGHQHAALTGAPGKL